MIRSRATIDQHDLQGTRMNVIVNHNLQKDTRLIIAISFDTPEMTREKKETELSPIRSWL